MDLRGVKGESNGECDQNLLYEILKDLTKHILKLSTCYDKVISSREYLLLCEKK